MLGPGKTATKTPRDQVARQPDRLIDVGVSADAGANLRELMERMEHSSTKAALVYLHSTSERQRTLAAAVGKLAKAELQKARKADGSGKASGTKVARRRGRAS